MSTPAERLRHLGLTLPAPPRPAGSYTRAVRTGNLVFVSGQLPIADGRVVHEGRVGEPGLTLAAGQEAARLCALNAVGVLAAELGDLDRVRRIVRMTGFVSSSEGFTAQAQVVNGASQLMADVFGDAGVHARVAVGVTALPLGAAVELELIAEVA